MILDKKTLQTKPSDGKLLRALPIAAGCLALGMCGSDWLAFKELPFTESPGAWGEFGDFIGGVLNPVISLFTLTVAISVWSLQKKELKATQNALVKQANLQTFFSLLAQHRELVNSVLLTADENRYVFGGMVRLAPQYDGRSAFSAVLTALEPRPQEDFSKKVVDEQSNALKFTPVADSFRHQMLFAAWYHGQDCGLSGYEDPYFLAPLEMAIGHIFRSITQILKFSYHADGLNSSERLDLVSYLSAQMSEDEFLLFGLVCLMRIGRHARGVSIAFDFFKHRMNSVEWAKSMKLLLDGSREENLEFAKQLGFEPVKSDHAD